MRRGILIFSVPRRICFIPGKIHKQKKGIGMIRRIFSYIGPYKKYGVLAAVCIVAETFFELIVPFIMADMVDVGVANGDKAYIF